MSATTSTLRVGFVPVLTGGDDYMLRPVQIQAGAWIVGYSPDRISHDQAVDVMRIALGDFQVVEPAETFTEPGAGE